MDKRPVSLQVFVSKNSKTGCSINVDRSTCQPTAACRKYCYGKCGPIAMSAARKRQADNALVFGAMVLAPQREVELEADAVYFAVRAARNDFLRWNGIGDLTPGAVRMINTIAERHPDLPIWVSTRKPAVAAKIARCPSVHVMLSFDATTPRVASQRMQDLIGGNFYGAYMSASADDKAPGFCSVIFAEHHGGNHAKWAQPGWDARLCPGTQHGNTSIGSCSTCRRCFDAARREEV